MRMYCKELGLIKSEVSWILSDAGNIAGSDMFLGMMDDLVNDICIG